MMKNKNGLTNENICPENFSENNVVLSQKLFDVEKDRAKKILKDFSNRMDLMVENKINENLKKRHTEQLAYQDEDQRKYEYDLKYSKNERKESNNFNNMEHRLLKPENNIKTNRSSSNNLLSKKNNKNDYNRELFNQQQQDHVSLYIENQNIIQQMPYMNKNYIMPEEPQVINVSLNPMVTYQMPMIPFQQQPNFVYNVPQNIYQNPYQINNGPMYSNYMISNPMYPPPQIQTNDFNYPYAMNNYPLDIQQISPEFLNFNNNDQFYFQNNNDGNNLNNLMENNQNHPILINNNLYNYKKSVTSNNNNFSNTDDQSTKGNEKTNNIKNKWKIEESKIINEIKGKTIEKAPINDVFLGNNLKNNQGSEKGYNYKKIDGKIKNEWKIEDKNIKQENQWKKSKESQINPFKPQNCIKNDEILYKNDNNLRFSEERQTSNISRKKWGNDESSNLKEKIAEIQINKPTSFKNIDNSNNIGIKSVNFEINFDESQESTAPLSELFKNRKGKLLKKLEEQKNESKKEDKPEKCTIRTKEEILKQRKEMMKKPDFIQSKRPNNVSNEPTTDKQFFVETIEMKNFKKTKEPPVQVLERLALGIKPKVSKKEMYNLTIKNYDALPEVKKKKELEKKKNEMKERQEKVKLLEKKLRGKISRNNSKNKNYD